MSTGLPPDRDSRSSSHSRRGFDDAILAFAAEVGGDADDPVTCVGGRTQWSVGRAASADGAPGRAVRAPAGVVSFEPAEMTVRVRAGTTITDLDEVLGEHGQTVALPTWSGATVGGVLAVGHSGIRRLGWGPVRDTLLELTAVIADGRVVKAGGPTVKNVTGYDLCRVFVGSLGTLGFLGEVVLRTRPRPAASRWLGGTTDPFELRNRLFRPSAILWDGVDTWVLLEGHHADVEAEAIVAASCGLVEVETGPTLPPFRSSHRPSALRGLDPASDGRFVAEIGVGTVHRPASVPAAPLSSEGRELNRRLKRTFDPTGRLNPGQVVSGFVGGTVGATVDGPVTR